MKEKSEGAEKYLRGNKSRRDLHSYEVTIRGGVFILFLMLVISVEMWLIMYGILNWIRGAVEVDKWVVRVSGCGSEEAIEIRRRVELYLRDKDVLFDLSSLKLFLERGWSFSRIDIKKELWGAVDINVELKEPFAYLVSGGGYVLDKEGEVIGEISEYSMEKGSKVLPVIYIEEGYKNKIVIKRAVRLVQLIANYEGDDSKTRQLRYEPREEVFYVKIGERVLKVSEVGLEAEISKYYKYRDEISDVVAMGGVLDLRFKGQIIVRR
jgi:hypothetical protein